MGGGPTEAWVDDGHVERTPGDARLTSALTCVLEPAAWPAPTSRTRTTRTLAAGIGRRGVLVGMSVSSSLPVAAAFAGRRYRLSLKWSRVHCECFRAQLRGSGVVPDDGLVGVLVEPAAGLHAALEFGELVLLDVQLTVDPRGLLCV